MQWIIKSNPGWLYTEMWPAVSDTQSVCDVPRSNNGAFREAINSGWNCNCSTVYLVSLDNRLYCYRLTGEFSIFVTGTIHYILPSSHGNKNTSQKPEIKLCRVPRLIHLCISTQVLTAWCFPATTQMRCLRRHIMPIGIFKVNLKFQQRQIQVPNTNDKFGRRGSESMSYSIRIPEEPFTQNEPWSLLL